MYRKIRSYDKEFKINTVKLYLEGERSYKQISEEMGIPVSTIRGWIKSYKEEEEEAFPGKGNLKASDAELSRLRKELRIAQEERDILKKALGIFSLQQK